MFCKISPQGEQWMLSKQNFFFFEQHLFKETSQRISSLYPCGHHIVVRSQDWTKNIPCHLLRKISNADSGRKCQCRLLGEEACNFVMTLSTGEKKLTNLIWLYQLGRKSLQICNDFINWGEEACKFDMTLSTGDPWPIFPNVALGPAELVRGCCRMVMKNSAQEK